MRIVARFLGETKEAPECGRSLQIQGIAAFGAIDRFLQVFAFPDEADLSGSRGVGQRALHVDTGKFSRSIKAC